MKQKQNKKPMLNHVEGCTFITKVWDEKSVNAVNDVAKALLNMTELFKSQNIQVTALSINNDKKDV